MFHHSGVNKHTIAMKEINDSAGIATAAKTMLITRSTFFLETTWFPFFIKDSATILRNVFDSANAAIAHNTIVNTTIRIKFVVFDLLWSYLMIVKITLN